MKMFREFKAAAGKRNSQKDLDSLYSEARSAILHSPPNPYARAVERAAVLHPTTDPNYQIRGVAPNGYRIAVALETALADAPVAPRAPMPRDQHGTPTGYSAEAIAAYARSRR